MFSLVFNVYVSNLLKKKSEKREGRDESGYVVNYDSLDMIDGSEFESLVEDEEDND